MSAELDLGKLLAALRPVAEEAGRATLLHYERPETAAKQDGSPVTLADTAAEAVILPALRNLTPDIPVISEEEAAAGLSPEVTGSRFWLVDPLDGTREFINHNGEFTVNIALIEAGEPVLGLVTVPVTGETYAAARGLGAVLHQGGRQTPITVRNPPQAGLTVVASRSHGDVAALAAFLEGIPVAETRSAGSSVKLCLLARGAADLYPRLGPTMEWDIAAGHAVLLAAGGTVMTLDGLPLGYGKTDFRNPFFVACGGYRWRG